MRNKQLKNIKTQLYLAETAEDEQSGNPLRGKTIQTIINN